MHNSPTTQQNGEGGHMNNAQRSLFVFGLCMVVVGLGLILTPMPIMHLFRLSAGEDIWIRFIGMLLSVLGVYYILVVRAKLDRFIPWTVATRFYTAAFMVVMVGLGKVEPTLLLFAAIDAGAATWTWFALRSAK
jgi:hypothetical protein